MDGTEKGRVEPPKSGSIAYSKSFEEFAYREGVPANNSSSIVELSWERCESKYKLDRDRHKGPEILTPPELRTATDRLDLLTHVAKPYIERLVGWLAPSNYVIILSDSNGIALEVLGTARPDRALRRVGVCSGALWGEDYAGTNGIGTALASHSAVTIHRSQHFFSTYAGLTCTATPIFDPQGEIIAALDASSVADLPHEMQSLVLNLVAATARRIERSYFFERNRDRSILRVEAGLANVQEGTGLLLALDDGGCPIELYGIDSPDLHVPDRECLLGNPLSDFMEISWQDTGVDSGDAERIGIAHLKDSGQPCFASLMTPRVRRRAHESGASTAIHQHRKKPTHAQSGKLSLDMLAGADPVMCEHVKTVRKLVDKQLPVLLQGETGTGKEEFARGVHDAGARSAKPFVVIDCSSIPESLIESELFGYETGTFTGARRGGRKGRIAEANGGTLFLDEIGDMPLAMQTRLLRVLAQGELVPLGTGKPIRVDFNVICASHRNLTEMVADGSFRQDLYYRIAGIRLELPPLRERSDKVDVILGALAIEAVQMDLGSPPRLSEAALDVLVAQKWPGNMRELRLAMRYALACASGDEIDVDRLPPWLGEDAQETGERSNGDTPTASYLAEVLERNKWCVSDAACELRVSRQTLYRWLRRQNISRPIQ
jgi:sigma-54 dependent transcriptional regulator, acetoin dehydrogenase operon transcriptional activator AcoR